MDIWGSREVDYLSNIKQPKIHASLYEYNNEFDGNYYVDKLLGTNSSRKGIVKCVSLPSFASFMSPKVSDIETELRRIWSSGSLRSLHSCYVSSPIPVKLVSALKGSREKHGISRKKLSVTWAPDVYDPLPTLLYRMIKRKKQRKLNKNNDKKKIGKKGTKGGSKSSRGSANGKDIKQFRVSSGSSYRWHKQQLVVEGSIANKLRKIDDFSVVKPDPWSTTAARAVF